MAEISEVRVESKDAIVVSLAIAHAIQEWLKYVPGSEKQKLLGLQFVSEIIRAGGPTWDIPVSAIMSSSSGMPSLTPYRHHMEAQVEH